MASSSRRGPGRPPRDARQLDLNFCFGESRVISSEDSSNMDVADDGEQGTPDSNEVTMLQNPPKVFLRKFNSKWKIGRRWLYWSKPPGGPIVGVMKCEACEEFKLGGIGSRTWGGSGCSTIQLSAVKQHEKSDDHKWSCQRWLAKHHPSSKGPVAPIEPGMQTMVEREKGRILTVMKLLYFVVSNDQPLLAYVDQCKFHMHLATPNMPSSFEYSSYTNVTSAMGFLDAISQNLCLSLIEEVKSSPVYSILIDESTDRTCEPHLIVYVCYLMDGGSGSTCVQFVELMPLSRGTGEVMFQSIKELLERLGFDLLKLVAIATDGAACMTGVHQGVVARLRDLVPNLVGIHCIAHREALAAKDANDEFQCLGFIDRAANKVYEWLGRSVIRRGTLAKLLLAFREETRVVLQIHSVRWLSRGMVMERMVFCMPAILESWQAEEPAWYTNITSLQFQFFIHLLADVLIELNKLNRKFQSDHVDITSIASTIDVTINMLRRHYLGVSFGTTTKHLGTFLRNVVPIGEILYVDRFGCEKVHTLHYDSMPGCDVGGSLEDCITLGRLYVQKVIDSLNDRFPDLPIFNAARLFSPKHYPMDALDRGNLTEQWLNRLVIHFKWSSILVDQANAELLEFVEMLSSACQHRSMHEAWIFCGCDREFKINWPTLMSLWQAILVIPTSTVVCERGFSKQNWVKSERRTCLNLDTLDALMRVSLNSLGVEFMDWNGIFDTWKTATVTNKRRALSLQELSHSKVVTGCKMVRICCKSVILVAMTTLVSFLEPGFTEAAQQSSTWQLKWAPRAQVEGLKAFEGVEDDVKNTDPGVKHIYADGTNYRFDMPLKERDSKPDRQRNEVKGMVDGNGNILRIEKGDTWRLHHRIFIPTSLQGTTSFTHIMQLLPLGSQGIGPIFAISLSRKNNIPIITLDLFKSGKVLGSTPLTPLQETWIESQITFTATDNSNIQWLLKDSRNKTVVSAQGSANLFLGDRV